MHKTGEVLGSGDHPLPERSSSGPGCDVEDSGHIGAQEVVRKGSKRGQIEGRVVPVPHYSGFETP